MSFIIARRASFKLCSIYSRGGGGGGGGSNHWKRLPIKILSQLNLIELGKFNAVISHTNRHQKSRLPRQNHLADICDDDDIKNK